MKETIEGLTATKHSTVQDKVRFILQFKKFVSGGFKRSDFPKWFYTQLSMTFGHIAHYNIEGFYNEFFTTDEGKIRFLEITRDHGGIGDPAFTYSDVELILGKWVESEHLKEGYEQRLATNMMKAEYALYLKLKEKYEGGK